MDARRLLDALATLGHDDREVLVFRYVVGLTETETADSIGAPVGTVKSRSSRALTRLRRGDGSRGGSMTDPSMSDTVLIDRLADLGEQLERDLLDAADDLRRRGRGADPRRARRARSGHRGSGAGRRSGRSPPRWCCSSSCSSRFRVRATRSPGGSESARCASTRCRRRRRPRQPADETARRRRPDDDRDRAWPNPTPTRSVSGPPVGRRRGGGGDRPAPPGGDVARRAGVVPPPRRAQIVARYDVDGRTVLVAVLAGTTDEPVFVKQVQFRADHRRRRARRRRREHARRVDRR